MPPDKSLHPQATPVLDSTDSELTLDVLDSPTAVLAHPVREQTVGLGEAEGLPQLDSTSFRRIVHAMADAVLVYRPDTGRVVFCNTACTQLLNLPDDAPHPGTLDALLKPLGGAGAVLAENLHQQGKPFTDEFIIYQNKRPRTLTVTTVPLGETGSDGDMLAVLRDITHIRQTEKIRRDFVANVSHELRTPLSAIQGYAETLLEGALEDPNYSREFVGIIHTHTQRLTHLVRDLLDLSRLELSESPFELTPSDLLPVISSAITYSTPAAQDKHITIHLEPPAQPLPQVCIHGGTVEQVVSNLLENAIKYTPEGGAVTISTMVRDDERVQVDVSDTGIGIDPKHIPRLFERFYRVDKARSRGMGGTGLGLSIVKHIVQNHGGDVWVESRADRGGGTTFSFTLKQAPNPD